MGKTTIEWANFTFNAWVGCTKVSPACDSCYAESWAKRTGHPELWAGDRRRTTVSYWQQPFKWNKLAAAAGERHRVFCCSLADVFDNQVPGVWRDDLWSLIYQTPHLDWLLLTKRPQNIAKMLPEQGAIPWGDGWPNVWLGMTAENQEEYDKRIVALMRVPAKIRFLSCEPLLGPLYLDLQMRGIHWVIAGGESGPNARPMHPAWARSLRDQCAVAGVSFHFKQNGEWIGDTQVAPGPAVTKAPFGSLAGDGDFRRGLWPANHQRAECMYRVGKKAAGRLLDGVEHNGMPRGVS